MHFNLRKFHPVHIARDRPVSTSCVIWTKPSKYLSSIVGNDLLCHDQKHQLFVQWWVGHTPPVHGVPETENSLSNYQDPDTLGWVNQQAIRDYFNQAWHDRNVRPSAEISAGNPQMIGDGFMSGTAYYTSKQGMAQSHTAHLLEMVGLKTCDGPQHPPTCDGTNHSLPTTSWPRLWKLQCHEVSHNALLRTPLGKSSRCFLHVWNFQFNILGLLQKVGIL